MSKLPPIALKPYCRKSGCRNPGTNVEVVTGIGTDPMTGEPIRRARVWCRWHGGHFLPIAEYKEAVTAQRVQEALLASAGGEWQGFALEPPWEDHAYVPTVRLTVTGNPIISSKLRKI